MMKVLIILSVFGFVNLVQAKTVSKPNPLLSPTIEITGKYIRADKRFAYIKPNNSKNLVKIQRSFMLNSPANLRKGMKVRYRMPLIAVLEANKKLLSKK